MLNSYSLSVLPKQPTIRDKLLKTQDHQRDIKNRTLWFNIEIVTLKTRPWEIAKSKLVNFKSYNNAVVFDILLRGNLCLFLLLQIAISHRGRCLTASMAVTRYNKHCNKIHIKKRYLIALRANGRRCRVRRNICIYPETKHCLCINDLNLSHKL